MLRRRRVRILAAKLCSSASGRPHPHLAIGLLLHLQLQSLHGKAYWCGDFPLHRAKKAWCFHEHLEEVGGAAVGRPAMHYIWGRMGAARRVAAPHLDRGAIGSQGVRQAAVPHFNYNGLHPAFTWFFSVVLLLGIPSWTTQGQPLCAAGQRCRLSAKQLPAAYKYWGKICVAIVGKVRGEVGEGWMQTTPRCKQKL